MSGLVLQSVGTKLGGTWKRMGTDARKAQLGHAEVLAGIGDVLALASPDLEAVFKAVTRYAGETIGDLAVLLLAGEDGRAIELASAYAASPELVGLFRSSLASDPLRKGEGIAGRVIARGEPVRIPLVDHALMRSMMRPEHAAMVRSSGVHSLLCVPLRARGSIIGTLSLMRAGTREALSDADQMVAQGIADRAALAIQNARLYQEAQAEISRRKEAERALALRAEELAVSEAALRRERSILEAIIGNMGDGVLVANENGKLVSMNPAGEEIVGIGVVDGAADAWVERYGVFLPDGVTPYPAERLPVARALAGVNVDQVELVIRNPNRPEGVVLSVTARPVREPGGANHGAVAVFRDITALKTAEDELRRRADALARSNVELEQFAYVASHDLQAPLRSVSSFLELLRKRYRGKLSEEADEFIDFAVDGAKRMHQLIRDLLAYSRAGRDMRSFSEIDLREVVDAAIQNLRPAIEESRAVIEVAELPEVFGSKSQLISLVQNLLDNAIKYRGEAAPRIAIRAVRRESDWEVSVEDNGMGFDPEDAGRIFQLFQRLNDGKETAGTGIGLAIAKKIAELHGGTIWAKSKKGEGATFTFTLPVPGRSRRPLAP